jgi:hypothetical protein
VHTIENDPENHKKLLEKMFQNTEGEKPQDHQIITASGAFTAKKQSREGSNHKVPERDSLGFFIVNPQQLQMNMEPMSSIYTGAPEKDAKTPMLGGKDQILDDSDQEDK